MKCVNNQVLKRDEMCEEPRTNHCFLSKSGYVKRLWVSQRVGYPAEIRRGATEEISNAGLFQKRNQIARLFQTKSR